MGAGYFPKSLVGRVIWSGLWLADSMLLYRGGELD
jgi:hypothetical protein